MYLRDFRIFVTNLAVFLAPYEVQAGWMEFCSQGKLPFAAQCQYQQH